MADHDTKITTDLLGAEVDFAWDKFKYDSSTSETGGYRRHGRVRAVYLKEVDGKGVLHLLIAEDDGDLDEREAEHCRLRKGG